MLYLGLLDFLLYVSLYDKGLWDHCDGTRQCSWQRICDAVLCPFSSVASGLVRVVFGLQCVIILVGAVVHLAWAIIHVGFRGAAILWSVCDIVCFGQGLVLCFESSVV